MEESGVGLTPMPSVIRGEVMGMIGLVMPGVGEGRVSALLVQPTSSAAVSIISSKRNQSFFKKIASSQLLCAGRRQIIKGKK